MELTQENIDKVAEVLRMGKLNESLLKVQDLSKLAEQLIKENPNLTAEEIGQKYEEEQLKLETTNQTNEQEDLSIDE